MTAYDAVQQDAAWLDLSSRGRLIVTGEDAARLLHALSTNHIKDLAEENGLYAFFLTAQGRILADANIFHRADGFIIDTEPEVGEKLREHIDRYIIADDAAVEILAGWSELSIEGPRASDHASQLGLPAPDIPFSTCDWQSGFAARIGSCTPDGIRVFGPESQLNDLRARLTIPQLSAEEARIVRIENGKPRYGEDISERYLVQETGLLHAVHFSKGCYLGQEIVERVRSRAQVHRHLHPIRIQSTEPPVPGTKLRRSDADAAEVTSAVYSPKCREVVGLAYVRTETLHDKPTLTVAGSDTEARLS